jgi:hypothetical protein
MTRLAITILVIVGVVVGCGRNERLNARSQAEEEPGCIVDDDCELGKVCENSACVFGCRSCPNGCGPVDGASCYVANDVDPPAQFRQCGPGRKCWDNMCPETTSDVCNSNFDCPAGHKCHTTSSGVQRCIESELECVANQDCRCAFPDATNPHCEPTNNQCYYEQRAWRRIVDDAGVACTIDFDSPICTTASIQDRYGVTCINGGTTLLSGGTVPQACLYNFQRFEDEEIPCDLTPGGRCVDADVACGGETVPSAKCSNECKVKCVDGEWEPDGGPPCPSGFECAAGGECEGNDYPGTSTCVPTPSPSPSPSP